MGMETTLFIELIAFILIILICSYIGNTIGGVYGLSMLTIPFVLILLYLSYKNDKKVTQMYYQSNNRGGVS